MTSSSHKNRAFTLIEVILIVFIMAVLSAVLLPNLIHAKRSSRISACQKNLKQIGLAHNLWLADHMVIYFPGEVSTNAGGTMEYIRRGELFQHFKLFTNEFANPRVLVCPSDCRQPAKNLAFLANSNLSYFLNGDLGPTARSGPPDRPMGAPWHQVVLGDRNVTNNAGGQTRILNVTAKNPLGWKPDMHNYGKKRSEPLCGNAGFRDGAAKTLTTAELLEPFRYDPSCALLLP